MPNNSEELDMLDRKILYELDLKSNLSFKELGKKLRVSKDTTAYRVKRLVANGFIKSFVTTMHTSNLNRFYYKFFYKFHKTTPNIDAQIVAFIQNYGPIAYFASTQGKYDITFLLLAKNMHDLQKFLTDFQEKFGQYVLEQEILTLTSVHRFNFRFFYDKGDLVHTHYPDQLKETNIDSLDYLLLKALAQNSRIPLIEIATQAKTDTNVIKYRIKKLKKLNVIGRPVLEIDFNKFGIQHIQVDFTFTKHSTIEKVIPYVATLPSSTFATVTLGKYDLAIELAVKNTLELTRILNQIKENFSEDIVNYDVFILQEHSVNWFPYQLGPSSL